MTVNAFKPYKIYPTSNSTLDGNSNRIALPRPAASGDVIKVSVIGTTDAFLNWGGSGVVAATTTSMPQLAGSVELYSLDDGDTHIAIIGTAGSVVYVTMGTGV